MLAFIFALSLVNCLPVTSPVVTPRTVLPQGARAATPLPQLAPAIRGSIQLARQGLAPQPQAQSPLHMNSNQPDTTPLLPPQTPPAQNINTGGGRTAPVMTADQFVNGNKDSGKLLFVVNENKPLNFGQKAAIRVAGGLAVGLGLSMPLAIAGTVNN